MERLKLIEGELPKGLNPEFESFLFNEGRHRRLQSEQDWVSFHLIDEVKKKSLAAIHFHVQNGLAQSPLKAPFGSVEFSKKLQPQDLFDFLRQIELNLRKHRVKRIQIKNPPAAYRPMSSPIVEILLLNSGYRVVRAEINTSVNVDEINFEKKIEAWELRKWKQGKKAKLKFRKIPSGMVARVYEFIYACRQEREQSLSMSLNEVIETADACVDNFNLFGVYQKEELIAASVSIRVTGKIMYNFYSGHPRKFDSMSPVVLLVAGMYEWCQHQHIELLDLGTSASGDQPNFGLLEFKRHLGGNASTKLTFEKDLT